MQRQTFFSSKEDVLFHKCHKTPGLLLLLACLPVLRLDAQKLEIYSRPVQTEPDRTCDFLHYRVTLTFDLDEKTFTGHNHVTLVSLTDSLKSVVLHADGLQVGRITDTEGRSMHCMHRDDTLTIGLNSPAAFGDTVDMTIAYSSGDPEDGLFFDEKTDKHPKMVSTDSWPDDARYWFPCYDHPHDKVTQEMIITAGRELKVLSNGRLISVTGSADPSMKTWHWSQEKPHSTYLSMLAIGPFDVVKDSLGSLPVNYWVYPGDAEKARFVFRNTPTMIAYFSDLFKVPYPWAKYDQVISPHQGGGAEATSATLLGVRAIYDRKAEKDFSFERVIAHEIAHQWWGDLITLRSWEETWMNESFGTYCDHLYTSHSMGPEEGAVDLLNKKDQYLREANTRYMRPIVFNRYETPDQNFDSHTYPKGAAVLHMLRFILGDRPFFKTLSRFLYEYAFQAVDTYDFMRIVKETTGRNMDWFFRQQVFSPGHAVFAVSKSWNKTRGTLTLNIEQVQDTTAGIPVYRLPVNIGITLPERKLSKMLWLDSAEEIFEIPLPDEPLLVRFDEGNHLLKEWTYPKSVEELVYQLRNDDVIGRQWAAEQLSEKLQDKVVVKALKEAVLNDTFWAVRRTAVTVLARVKQREWMNTLKGACFDPHSRVRAEAYRILGTTERSDIARLMKARFKIEDSYLAQASALKAIGKCGDDSFLAFLERASKMASYRDILKHSALQAIEEIHSR